VAAARYDKYLLGVFPVGDLTAVVAAAGCEVVILEEPEHLTWYHHGPRWTEAFPHVVRGSNLLLMWLQRGR
jgi:digalactosyldiacylglycerol synthase